MPNEQVSELALRLGDQRHEEFEPGIYNQAIYRAEREVSKRYEILQKLLSFRYGDMVQSIDQDVILDISDFKEEFLVTVNGNPLVKVNNFIMDHYQMCYYLERRDNQWVFNYRLNAETIPGLTVDPVDITEEQNQDFFERSTTLGEDNQKTLEDEVTISYTIVPDRESSKGEYILPSIYDEEIIERALTMLIKLGLAKFTSPEKVAKYTRLHSIYVRNSEFDKTVMKNDQFPNVQPFRYP